MGMKQGRWASDEGWWCESILVLMHPSIAAATTPTWNPMTKPLSVIASLVFWPIWPAWPVWPPVGRRAWRFSCRIPLIYAACFHHLFSLPLLYLCFTSSWICLSDMRAVAALRKTLQRLLFHTERRISPMLQARSKYAARNTQNAPPTLPVPGTHPHHHSPIACSRIC
jgi:hypothetical protein